MGKPKKAKKAAGKQTSKKPAPKPAAKPQVKAAAKPKGKPAKPQAKPQAKGKPAKAKVAPKGGGSNASGSARAVAALQARWPALSDREVEAFDSLVTPAQADDLGKRTKSGDVLREAARWAAAIDTSLRAYGDGALKFYSPRRFAYFLHNAATLGQAIAVEEKRKSAIDATRGGAEGSRAEAMKAREETIERLATFAGMRIAERKQLEDASGVDTSGSAERLVRALRQLAILEVDWLERNDPQSQVLAAAAGLSYENAQALRSYAESLSSKKVATLLDGALAAKDTPTINRIEGRVLFEMREAKRVFSAAHDRNGVVPHLVPSGNIAHAFGQRTVKKPVPASNGKPVTPPLDDDQPDVSG